MNQQVIIFDTTLRDGEQSLQSSLNTSEKLKIALALEKMGIDIIEAGFPISSPEDFKSVQTISNNIKHARICSLARCVQKDIDIAVQAMQLAKNFRIHIFLGTSNLHVTSKLKKNFKDILEMAVYFVKYARNFTDDIEFSCEDAGRTSMSNLYQIVSKTIQAGASTINIPDTVGFTIPNQFSKIIQNLYENVTNIHQAIISVHCHNDLGMAVANSIAAIQSGARQVEGTINGIGERAGNAALEELAMIMKIKSKLLNVKNNINYKEIYNTSRIVSQICNVPIPFNKAIVGKNAFAHSSGIHQDGVLKNRENYEIFTPDLIGLKTVKLNLTSRSGRAVVKHYMGKMGYSNKDYDLNLLYINFLKLADQKGQLFDYDLEILAFVKDYNKLLKFYKLIFFNAQLKFDESIIITIKMNCGEKTCSQTISTTKGLFYAINKACMKITNYPIFLKKVKIVTNQQKTKILNQTYLTIKYLDKLFYGTSASTNFVKSYILAITKILNSIFQYRQVNKNKKIYKK
ncbi:2-isopropylmalate synthase (plasmid) [Buchnera aphidicola (Nipponaphis monzeni)]|uniref:2-isopropylmalate synthase n=1 Tax=Buchnera aphidicola (Nipponaphis monzeni) TaxID=2495405 RepID=A0A455TAW4_9GAMM|nr:2-isopropylmalate synthase [Buchnera aphidicola]BBI01456.1 2-isopropylmalate synthase [Buchnera aphidicola (Nipponaphis monzeni)]